MQLMIFLVIGLVAGVLAGIFGVGGGIIIVPALVMFAGFSQVEATGTSLVALLAPVGIGAVYAYYHAGKITGVHIKGGLMISVAIFFGAILGSKLALGVPDVTLKRSFACFLVLVAARMWWGTIK